MTLHFMKQSQAASIHTTPYLLCIAMVVLPFSIAVANVLFACSLLTALLAGIWKRGSYLLWQQARTLSLAWLAYIAIMLLGLIWSPDISRGLVIVSKQWSWLIIPMFIAVCLDRTWQNRILFSISLGLLLHLLLCIAQSQGIDLPVRAPGGSSLQDPAGLIGHISFGLIYGMWAAWLIHIGVLNKGKRRYLLWSLAAFAIFWVFMVQGRSGYLVVLTLACIMAWKLWFQYMSPRLILTAIAVLIVAIALISIGPAQKRVQSTIDSLTAFSQGDLKHAEARISLWYLAWESWKTSPIIGIGTGGFPSVSDTIAAQNPNLNLAGQTHVAVPHNIYLMELSRWGPLGLIILLVFLSAWVRLGWKLDWQQSHHLLISLSGIALAVHGLTSQSIEEYHASIYTAIFLAIGLASLTHSQD